MLDYQITFAATIIKCLTLIAPNTINHQLNNQERAALVPKMLGTLMVLLWQEHLVRYCPVRF